MSAETKELLTDIVIPLVTAVLKKVYLSAIAIDGFDKELYAIYEWLEKLKREHQKRNSSNWIKNL